MAQVQYNFKIENELKSKAEELSKEFSNKQDFLKALLNNYQTSKNNQSVDDIDITKFEDIDNKTKAMLSDTFKHIIYTLQQNSTATRQELLSVEKEKKAIEEERAEFKKQIQELQAKCNQELLSKDQGLKEQLSIKDEEIQKIKVDIKDIQNTKDTIDAQLQAKEKELAQVQSIANQSQSIAKENQELRKELKQLEKAQKQQLEAKEQELKKLNTLLRDKENIVYKKDIDIQNMEKELKKLQNDIIKHQHNLKAKDTVIKELEKQNTILATKLEMRKEKLKESRQ